jgi:UDP-glucose 4-epimerase
VKLLVTGGAGYVGSVVAYQLIEADHETVVLDNLLKKHEKAVISDAWDWMQVHPNGYE